MNKMKFESLPAFETDRVWHSIQIPAFAMLIYVQVIPAQTFPPTLIDELSGAPLGTESWATTKLIVFIHGWNPPEKEFWPAATDVYQESENWKFLVSAMKQRLKDSGNGWGLVLYHWEQDANTGLVYSGPDHRIGQDPFSAAIANATEAAPRAFTWHGPNLARRINEAAPTLEKAHLIAHSAGSWAAAAAANHLLALNSKVIIQITLLDPFIPGRIWPVAPDTLLDARAMSDLARGANQNRIYRLENFYAEDDETWCALGGTQGSLTWRATDINQQVDWDETPNGAVFHSCMIPRSPIDPYPFPTHYSSHSGPIAFYAET